MKMLLKITSVVTLGWILVACAASIEGYPDRSLDVEQELKALAPLYDTNKISEYNKETDTQKKRGLRNDYVYARMSAIDLQFGKFEQAIFREGVGSGILTDWIELALGGAGAVFSGGTSQALSAASAGVVGAKGAFDKQAYFSNTITTLLAAMVANRKTVEVKIRQRLAQSVADYPLAAALSDLEEYYVAGTIPGALTGIAEESGAKAKKAEEILSGKFRPDDATKVLNMFVGWDGKRFNNSGNKSKLESWMTLHGIDPKRITLFLNAEEYADKRSEAVTFFKL